jgi:hypothetical protein
MAARTTAVPACRFSASCQAITAGIETIYCLSEARQTSGLAFFCYW